MKTLTEFQHLSGIRTRPHWRVLREQVEFADDDHGQVEREPVMEDDDFESKPTARILSLVERLRLP
jgi:hypothetical protein